MKGITALESLTDIRVEREGSRAGRREGAERWTW